MTSADGDEWQQWLLPVFFKVSWVEEREDGLGAGAGGRGADGGEVAGVERVSCFESLWLKRSEAKVMPCWGRRLLGVGMGVAGLEQGGEVLRDLLAVMEFRANLCEVRLPVGKELRRRHLIELAWISGIYIPYT